MLNPVVSVCVELSCVGSETDCTTRCPVTRSTSRLSLRRQVAHQERLIGSNLGNSALSVSRFLLFSCSSLATCLLLLVSILIPVRLASTEVSVAVDNRAGERAVSSELAAGLSAVLGGSVEEKLLGGAGESRQYFKLRVIPSPSNSARRKRAHARAAGNRSEHKQKITNAALKKLLNQSLLKAANSSSPYIFTNNSLASPSSNFRLVFVQKAPALSLLSSTTTQPAATSETTHKDAADSSTDARQASSSSAGSSGSGSGSSLSKQLAETLISSTLNMAFNSPSISSLASKLAVKGFETMMANRNSSSAKPAEIADGRMKNPAAKKEHAPLSTSINSKTRQPSKVYNLPIKFVADGQPYHISVLSALKKHLLTSAASTNSNLMKKSHHKTHHHLAAPVASASLKISKHTDQFNKHRKLENSHKKKDSHGNSRLIYLPLKYFNNGRISKVILNSSSPPSPSSSASLKRKGR